MKTLFIGNFLSAHRGTKGISENVMGWLLEEDGLVVRGVSGKKHPLTRALDIVFTAMVFRPNKVLVDTYSNFAFNITVIATLLKTILNFRLIAVVHGGKFVEFYKSKPVFVQKVLRRVDTLKTPSLFIQKFLESEGFQIEYFPNPVKLNNFPFASNLTENKKLLWVRGFKDIYQPLMAIKVLELVLKSYPNASLTMIGPDGGLLKEIKNYIEKNGLDDKVYLAGPINNDQLYAYMHNHHIFLNTTLYESFGMAVLEAAASGIIVVSTCVGELPLIWVKDDEVCLLSENTPESMAKEVIKLIDNPAKSVNMRQKARLKAEQYDWELLRKIWVDLLKN